MLFDRVVTEGFEQIVYFSDSRLGLKGIVAMHSTVLGPAVGGVRMWNYSNEEEALTDVLRLSKGMTYKASLAGLNWGGGKAVIMGDPKVTKSKAFLERYGDFVERLGGYYVTAKDVGINCDDLRIVKTKTKHVLGIDGEQGSSGDPSPATAWGVYHGMRACAQEVFGNPSLKGKTVVVQGLGSVAHTLVGHLVAEGVTVVGSDVDQVRIEKAVKDFNIEIVRPEAVYDVPCDLFSPNALGAGINFETIPRLKTRIVAGAANNQLATPEDGIELMKRGILYAPDYVINAGGLINIYFETLPGGYKKQAAFDYTAKIEKTLGGIFARARIDRTSTHVVADQMAEERIAKGLKT